MHKLIQQQPHWSIHGIMHVHLAPKGDIIPPMLAPCFCFKHVLPAVNTEHFTSNSVAANIPAGLMTYADLLSGGGPG
jgi:hypothetical protein